MGESFGLSSTYHIVTKDKVKLCVTFTLHTSREQVLYNSAFSLLSDFIASEVSEITQENSEQASSTQALFHEVKINGNEHAAIQVVS